MAKPATSTSTRDEHATEAVSFEGQVALVTGAASGIGRSAAIQFAALGANIVVADIDEPEGRLTTEMADDAGSGEVQFVRTDVASKDEVADMVHAAVDRWGRLDMAFNNAGMSGTYAPLPLQELDDWDRTLAVNLTSVFLCLQAEIPAMLDSGGGAIVNTASAAGQMGFANLPAYVATKHAVVGLTKSVALEYARQDIRVNVICPGTVRTTMMQAFAGSDEAIEKMGAMAPIGRIGEPDEIARVAVWLCSPAASFMTGAVVPVDGGVLAT
jgi:NAD(P)-dependent dehydrogenase (short-subunit alcohol dehydrogenase family)